MRRRIVSVMLGLGMLAAAAGSAHAGTFGSAAVLRPGELALGLEPALTFSPAAFEFYLHGDIGLARALELDAKLGFGNVTYFGADLRFGLMPDTSSSPGLMVAAGAHGTTNLGLDATLEMSKRFSTFSLYGALNTDLEFLANEVIMPWFFNLGVQIPIARKIDLILEGNIGLNQNSPSGISGGVRIYF